jgi:hypothetical protein
MVKMDQWEIADGPLEGEIVALEGKDRDQFKLRLDDGRVAIYSAHIGKTYGIPNRLLFVGIDVSDRLV